MEGLDIEYEDGALNATLKELQTIADKAKHDREVSIPYMKIYDRERMVRNERIAQGRTYRFAESIKALLSEYGKLPVKITSVEEFAQEMYSSVER